ncbi:Ig-like domain-containing protein [Candidatus Nitrosotalea bavarica]|uniref:Ig-like domain-containing protein n=1 Tax=Candidatus Nitrosotalea bavarica TaxID=1903277 RepID=UPI0010560728|nr:Ig-like domain-containing protein [Candidatus Nitrosotalea bavarica]
MKKFLVITILVVGIMIMFLQPLAFGQYYQIHHTILILNPISRTAQQGDHLTFSGTLLTADDKIPLSNRMVFIQYDSPYDWTRIRTSATTDNNGNFVVSWTVNPKGTGICTYNFFAKYNGDDNNFWSISKQFLLNVTPRSIKN